MKALLSFVFVCFTFLGFSQERKQLETPPLLKSCKVELPADPFPKIINPNKSKFDVDGNAIRWFLCPPTQTRVITEGLPAQYNGGFITFYKNPESGWYETAFKRR